MESMVFRWFWGMTTIGNDGFRWLRTIGPTMEWLCTIVEVYPKYLTPFPMTLTSSRSWSFQPCRDFSRKETVAPKKFDQKPILQQVRSVQQGVKGGGIEAQFYSNVSDPAGE